MLFKAHKGGKEVLIKYDMFPISRGGVSDPIPLNLIYGVDTESLTNFNKELQTVAIPYYNGFEENIITHDTLLKYTNPFTALLDEIFNLHALPEKSEIRPSNTKIRGEFNKRRAGRHKLPFVLLVWYNLEYDISRLFHPDSNFWRAVKTGHDGVKISLDNYELEIRHHLLYGSAPHFSYIFRKDGYILEVKAIDMWGYWKAGLNKTAVSLGLEGKIDIEEEFFDRDLETLTPEEWEKLYTYAKRDPVATRGVYIKTAELLSSISFSVYSKGILPPSAPKAAAKICFGNLEKSKLDAAPINCIQHALNGYHGGYVYALVKGRVNNISVIDRKSAYPTILKMLPNPERATYHSIPSGSHFDSLIGKYGFIVASFDETDKKYPCVSLFGNDGRTMHPWGKFNYVTISIPELAVGYLTGTVKNITVHNGFYISGEKGGIFYNYIERIYDIKNQSESTDPMYAVSKLLMNSLYGKLIEIHDAEGTLIYDTDYDLIVADNPDPQYKKMLIDAYANNDMVLFEELSERFKNGKVTLFGKFLTKDICTVGNYFMPVYASLVTALQRAWVVLCSKGFYSVCGDTDSIFTQIDIDSNEFEIRRAGCDNIAQKIGIGRVEAGKNLGDFEIELKNGHGYIAGIKQYYLYNPNGKDKQAHHTIIKPDIPLTDHANLSKKELENVKKLLTQNFYADAIRDLSQGITVDYVGASSPVKLKTALMRGKDFGKFEKQTRRITGKYDNRLEEVSPGVFEWKNVQDILYLLESEEG